MGSSTAVGREVHEGGGYDCTKNAQRRGQKESCTIVGSNDERGELTANEKGKRTSTVSKKKKCNVKKRCVSGCKKSWGSRVSGGQKPYFFATSAAVWAKKYHHQGNVLEIPEGEDQRNGEDVGREGKVERGKAFQALLASNAIYIDTGGDSENEKGRSGLKT